MPKFSVYGKVVGSKYIGTVNAKNKKEAEEKAWEHRNVHVSLCHQCADECDDPEIVEITVEED